jgi:hypothetical protein
LPLLPDGGGLPVELDCQNAEDEGGPDGDARGFPKTILLIKTTGDEEGGQQYTRANAIVLNHNILMEGHEKELRQCIARELFHVLSRQNPDLREKFAQSLDFRNEGRHRRPPAETRHVHHRSSLGKNSAKRRK